MPEAAAASTHSTQDGLDIGMATDVGRVREANEDALLVLRGEGVRTGQALVAVADGMGGHKAGEVASALAIESMRRALEEEGARTAEDLSIGRALQGEVDPTAASDDLPRQGTELGYRSTQKAAADLPTQHTEGDQPIRESAAADLPTQHTEGDQPIREAAAADLPTQGSKMGNRPIWEAAAADLLRRGVDLGNRTIWEAAAADIDKDGMGTTLVCALLTADGRAVIGNVGDSRAYSVIDGKAALVTADHTWVNQQVQMGQMSEREARVSPFRNLLTRSLGNQPHVEVDLVTDVQLGHGDALVLVSDGVTGYLDERDVSTVLRESTDAQQAAERLVQEAVERGGADNATAVVVRRNR